MDKPAPLPRAGRKDTTIARRLAWSILALVIGVNAYLEFRARRDATAYCDSVAIGAPMPLDPDVLLQHKRDLAGQFRALYAITPYTEEGQGQAGKGVVIAVFPGFFPFGRQYCVLTVEKGVVAAKRTIFDADDYGYCKGEVRHHADCGQAR